MAAFQRSLHWSTFPTLAVLLVLSAGVANAQDYDRYRPHTVSPSPAPQVVPKNDLPPMDGSDRELVKSLDAVIVVDSAEKVEPKNAFKDAEGIVYKVDSADSLVHSHGFQQIINSYLGQPVTLSRLNAMSREMILFYRGKGQPVVDIVIPEQRITKGTVQIVVIESRIGRVFIEDGCYFDACDLRKWISCTRQGSRIKESMVSNDLFWLNQNGFRRVDVDLRPGEVDGTTDVIFEVDDVRPWNAYVGYEDTGVSSLMLERLYTGLIWGNAFGRGGMLSYQYTGDADFRHLHAHAVSYVEPLSRKWSMNAYGSWAAVDPIAVAAVTQQGESWQVGMGLTRYLSKNRCGETSFNMGLDFKSTNNNLEFGGINIFNSTADLVQLRFGLRKLQRYRCGEYLSIISDTFVGPGSGFTSDHTTAAFNTIRAGTSTDYVYSRTQIERLWNVPRGMELVTRFKGQTASERLLFSETLGFGGFDSIRGYDQRDFSGDQGWIVNLELGPKKWKRCLWGQEHTFRLYGLVDVGQAIIEDPLPGETHDEILASAGVGFRWAIGDHTNMRVDYAHGFEDSRFFNDDGRVHIGFVSVFGPRP